MTLSIDYQVGSTALEGDRVRVTLNQITDPNSSLVGAAASVISMSLAKEDGRNWFAGDTYTMTLTPKAIEPVVEPAADPSGVVDATGPQNSSVVDAAAPQANPSP